MPLQCQVCFAVILGSGSALACGHIFHFECATRAVEGSGRCAFKCEINRQDEFLNVFLPEYEDSLTDETKRLMDLNKIQSDTIENLQLLTYSLVGKLKRNIVKKKCNQYLFIQH